jgi:O-succinylbenzoate synthase
VWWDGRVQPIPVSIPMRERFRGITVRELMVVEGPSGWGEFSPFDNYGPQIAANWWRACAEATHGNWPAPVRDSIPVNVTVPALGPEASIAIVNRSGCGTAKVKVAEAGQCEADDLARLEAVRSAMGPAGKIRIDVNAGWDVDTAVDRIARYAHAAGGLEYVEQPCPSVEDLRDVRRRVDVPIAADESIRLAEDPMRVAALEAADIVVLKVQPLGGVWKCLELAERCGLPVVVSSAIESSVGIAMGLALAAALPQLPYACGLATVDLLMDDIVDTPLLPVDGAIGVSRPVPTLARLQRLAMPGPRAEIWRRRLEDVLAVLAATGGPDRQ